MSEREFCEAARDTAPLSVRVAGQDSQVPIRLGRQHIVNDAIIGIETFLHVYRK